MPYRVRHSRTGKGDEMADYGVQVDNKTKNVKASSAASARNRAGGPGNKRFMVDGKGVYAGSRGEAMKKAAKAAMDAPPPKGVAKLEKVVTKKKPPA